MQFTNNEIATYLFCAQLSQTKTIPLTILEWNSVVKSLNERKLQPETLLTMTSSELLNVLTQATDAQKSKILKKVAARQKLGISMLELEGIIQQGYNIMFRQHMPPRLKKLTQKFLPAFFYYVGDPSILTHRILGIVGARNANSEELLETTKIARDAVAYGVVINSGGARGVDMTAVEASLQNGGKAIIFPVEGLSKWVKKREIRQYIMNGQLLLMSTQRLDAPFSPAFAMQRNKFIHATSDAVLVASSKISGAKSSGTWEGVLENLKMQWSPIYVIGESEGVQKLNADGHAKYFHCFEDIYKKSIASKQLRDKDNINVSIKKLIKLAADNGMDKEKIKKNFIELLEQHYKEESSTINEKIIQSENDELEQLSISDILK